MGSFSNMYKRCRSTFEFTHATIILVVLCDIMRSTENNIAGLNLQITPSIANRAVKTSEALVEYHLLTCFQLQTAN